VATPGLRGRHNSGDCRLQGLERWSETLEVDLIERWLSTMHVRGERDFAERKIRVAAERKYFFTHEGPTPRVGYVNLFRSMVARPWVELLG
jgi:hypothetical protein